MRTNHAGVTEKAEFKIDQDKYAEGWERVFGKKEIPNHLQGEFEDEEGNVLEVTKVNQDTGAITFKKIKEKN